MAKYAYFTGDDSERFHFVMIPYMFFEDEKLKKLSSDAKILYGLMLGRMNLSRKNGWLDEKGRVYIRWSNEELCKDLGRSEPTVVKIKKELEKEGLIEKDRMGLGKCDLIYVKDILHRADENEEEINLPNEPGTPINTQNLGNFIYFLYEARTIKRKLDNLNKVN